MDDTFTGFPPAGVAFLAGLAADNAKTSFNANRDTYANDVAAPLRALVVAADDRLRDTAVPDVCWCRHRCGRWPGAADRMLSRRFVPRYRRHSGSPSIRGRCDGTKASSASMDPGFAGTAAAGIGEIRQPGSSGSYGSVSRGRYCSGGIEASARKSAIMSAWSK